MNRFVHFFIAGLILLSCKEEDDPGCVEMPTNVSGELLWLSSTGGGYIYDLGGDELAICNQDLFDLEASNPGIIRLDSAIIDPCQDCLEIIDWSGPACDFQFELNDSEHSLHHTTWKFDRYISREDTLLAPCIGTVEATLPQDDFAMFYLGNAFRVAYELTDNQIIFESDPIRTLAGVHGYMGEIEVLFDNLLFSDVPYNIQISNNQLIFSEGEERQFIFYAE